MVNETPQTAAAVPLRRSAAWPPFVQTLASVLGTLEEDQFLVISVKRTNRFVQFAGQGGLGIRAETTSNSYLNRSQCLDARQIAALGAAGWHGPTGGPGESTPERDPDGSPNFYREFPVPVRFEDVAELAVHTLTEILRVPYPGFLEYEAFDAEERAIVLPSLGLKPAMRSPRTEDVIPLPQQLLATLRETMSIPELEFDQDGDIGVRFGSVAVFVCLIGNPPSVHIHARLLVDVEETSELVSRLNDLNADTRFLHFFLDNGAVHAAADVPAEPFIGVHVSSVFLYFCQIADGIDSLLQAEFGGSTTFLESAPSLLKH
ncbi:hypothetical protein CCR95_21920 [Thiocystis minor]|uniref:T3SS (YopN, CesT) and YbjN peptide-binding chaperone 1 n=1 Tax=Thiocystis minor TaxID=61597 RepID=UPI00191345DC|nr:YbjN domain-containing protein [Thiocystis minor]MBK5966659.1 hypothetical protein [Thiocystis minor]